MKIAILSNVIKSNPTEAIHAFIGALCGKCEVFFAKELEGIIPADAYYTDEELFKKVDVAVVFGGDGTTLCAARRVAPYNLPLLSINTGHLGFLATVGAHEAQKAAENLLSGSLVQSERLMLNVKVVRKGETVFNTLALNDVIIRRMASRITNISLSVNNEHSADYRADGIVISTPTGSTAYSLSCGGPLVTPGMRLFVISPICPHILSSRAMIVPSESRLGITFPENCRDMSISADGQEEFELNYGDEIVISDSSYTTKLLTLKEHNFFNLVRQKLTKE